MPRRTSRRKRSIVGGRADIINIFFNSYPTIRSWIDEQHEAVCKTRQVINKFGRIRKLPSIDCGYYADRLGRTMTGAEALQSYKDKFLTGKTKYSPFSFVQGEVLRQSQNSPIQSAASDITCMAMIRLHNRIKKEGLGIRLLMNIHDAIYFEVPIATFEKEIKIIKEEMENPILESLGVEMRVPMKVDIESGPRWGKLKDIEEDTKEFLKEPVEDSSFKIEEKDGKMTKEDEMKKTGPLQPMTMRKDKKKIVVTKEADDLVTEDSPF